MHLGFYLGFYRMHINLNYSFMASKICLPNNFICPQYCKLLIVIQSIKFYDLLIIMKCLSLKMLIKFCFMTTIRAHCDSFSNIDNKLENFYFPFYFFMTLITCFRLFQIFFDVSDFYLIFAIAIIMFGLVWGLFYRIYGQ